MATILIVDDDKNIRTHLATSVRPTLKKTWEGEREPDRIVLSPQMTKQRASSDRAALWLRCRS